MVALITSSFLYFLLIIQLNSLQMTVSLIPRGTFHLNFAFHLEALRAYLDTKWNFLKSKF